MKKDLFKPILALALSCLMLSCTAETDVKEETESESENVTEVENTPDDCAAAEFEVIEKYERGDTPRIYIETYPPCENYSLSASVTASSEEDGNPVVNAIDGDNETSWVSSSDEKQTITLDLGEIKYFSYLWIEWGNGSPKEYDILLSYDGVSYTTLDSVTNGSKFKLYTNELEEVTARYVKLETYTTCDEKSPYNLKEFSVYSNKQSDGVTLDRYEYARVNIAVVDKIDGEYDTVEAEVNLRIRGNSTANTVKNPYNIKFDKKTKLLGMDGTKKWVLLANLFDKTLIRNKLAMDFTAEVGITPALNSCFVEVYLDGEYKGNYTLCNPVSDGIVGIDEDDGELLLERNGYYNLDLAGVNYNYTPVTGIRFVPVAPEKGEETEEQKELIRNVLAEAENAVISGDRERIEGILNLESFVNMYICEELMKDVDINYGSTYFYYKNERLYSGPMWDMDLSMGNVSVAEGYLEDKYAAYTNMVINGVKFGDGVLNDSTSGVWAQVDFYEPLMKCDWFVSLVRERYVELIPLIENLYVEGGKIDEYISEYGESFLRNYSEGGYSMKWKYMSCEYDTPYPTYEENVEMLREWLRKRDAWFREYLGINE